MPIFQYKGIDAASKPVKGTIDAESEKAARLKLRKLKIFPTQLLSGNAYEKKSLIGGGVNAKQVAHMTRQLSILLNANIPLVDALTAVQDQVEHPLLRKAIAETRDKVSEGARFWECLRAYPKIFDAIYINMVKAGETSGALELILTRLADYKENQVDLMSKITASMIYPIIMMTFSGGMMIFLFGFVIPEMARLFEKQKVELPKITQVVLAISHFITGYWVGIILFFVLMLLFFRSWRKTPAGRKRLDLFKLKVRIFGKVNQKIIVARFSRTLSTLLTSGVQLLQGLEIVRDVLNNVVLAEVVDKTITRVKEGESLSESLRSSGHFPNMFIHMLSIGEKTGMLESMLSKVADTYDLESRTAIGGLTSLITPVLAITMGLVVAVVVFSVLMPIMQLGNAAQF